MFERIVEWAAWAVVCVGAVFSMGYRFYAPGLTETQLFIGAWPVWLAMIIAAAVLGYFQWSRA